jgi:lysophospholipase L1-like esterase
VALACVLAAGVWAHEPVRAPDFLQRAFAVFDAADQVALPPPGGVLFVGSSSIAFWPDLREEFEAFPVVIQRGIVGSRMSDLARHADRLAVRYRPARIVVYAGENDIAAGLAPAAVLESFRHFVADVTEALPGVTISWISIKPSPSRWNLEASFRETNTLLSAWIRTRGEVDYIDLHRSMLGSDGLPRRELYAHDQLHLSAAGYALWEEVIEIRLR